MSRTPARFTQADIARAHRVATEATKRGAPTAVEIAPDGTIRLVPITGPMPGAPPAVEPQRKLVL